MGWTFTNRPRGTSHERWFKNEFGDAATDPNGRGVLRAMGGNRAGMPVYIAYQVRPGEVIGIVCLIDWRVNDHFNFGYKDITEDMGPCEHDCPEEILRLLTPLKEPPPAEDFDHEDGRHWAWRWRQQCWARIEARKARLPLKRGALVRFKHPVYFTDGHRATELRCYDPKRLIFYEAYMDTDRFHWGGYKLKRRLLEDAEVIYDRG